MDGNSDNKKRFHIQHDRFARDRISALKSSVGKMIKTDNGVISASLYGSLSKGGATFVSDIDAFLFVDPSTAKFGLVNAAGKLENLYRFVWGEGMWEGVQIRTCCPALRKDVEQYYTSILHSHIKNILPEIKQCQLEHVQVLPINYHILDKLIAHIITDTDRRGRFFSEVVAANEHRGQQDTTEGRLYRIAYPSVAISALFHLEIGSGLQRYRKYVIHKFLSEKKCAVRLWTEIVKATEAREQKVAYTDLPTSKTYPRTLTDALRHYTHLQHPT